MWDIYADETPIQVVMKAAQVGASTMEIIKTLHDARFLGINQIYTLPTVDDVQTFVPSKVNRIIKVNPCIRAGIDPKSIDSVEQKQIGKAFLYFKGTYTEREAIILTSDRNIHDELDKSKPEVVRDDTSRMGYSEIRSQHYFSTPTIPDFGIDALWQQSDQKHWRFNCPHCGFRQHMKWEENIDFEEAIYVCQSCRKEITPRQISELGEWEARFPGEPISGYWISQMICPWRTARDLIEERDRAEDEQYFYNFILGLPYLSAEQRIEASLFLGNITNERPNFSEWQVMGVDTGDENHVIIGNEKGIFWIGALRDKPNSTRWQQMEELIQSYNVRVCVIDALPYTEEAQKLAKEFPYQVYLNFFKDDPKMLEVVRFGDEREKTPDKFEDEIKVLTSRNRIYDDTISALRRGEIKFAMPPNSPTFQLLIKHAQSVYSRTVTDRFGQERREWANLGTDHLWTALIYWHIALNKRLKFEPNR